MRILLILATLAGLLRAADEPKTDEAVVKKVRALLSTRKADERAALLAELKATPALDWASVKAGLVAGPYYKDPLATEFGERHSPRDLGLRLAGEDKRERTFSYYLPKAYKAEEKIPVLLYLHHDAGNQDFGSLRGSAALLRFRDACEKATVLFVAPSTNQGAEWWTPEGRKLVRWTLDEVRARINVDEDRIALAGVIDGASAVWSFGQLMPDTWSGLVPLTGNPGEIAEDFHALYMGTLDRMDVLAGVTGSNPGGLNLEQMLDVYKPMLRQGMRLTLRTFPRAGQDVSYIGDVVDEVVAFAANRKRKPLADEVDIESDEPAGARSLWLELHGAAAGLEGDVEGFGSTVFPWSVPPTEKPKPKLGVGLRNRHDGAAGLLIQDSEGGAQRNGIGAGDILLEIDGAPVSTVDEVRAAVEKHTWKDDVRVLLAREIMERDLERVRAQQERYVKRRARLLEMEKAGQEGLDVDDVEDTSEEDAPPDTGTESTFKMDDTPGEDGGAKPDPQWGAPPEPRVWFLFERWVRLREPEGPLVRRDFGASWDAEFKQEGVKLARVLPHARAWRAGLRDGDVIFGVGGSGVKKVRDVRTFFETFDFKGFVDFDVKRQNAAGEWEEKTITIRWDPPVPGRVDGQWNRSEKILNVLAHDAASFSIYFTDEILKPGEEFFLFVNGVPWADLADPATAPDYPDPVPGDLAGDDYVKKMRMDRAKQPGWAPDPLWAIEDGLARRDRSLVFGAKRTFDLKPARAAFEAAKAHARKQRAERDRELDDARKAHAGAKGNDG